MRVYAGQRRDRPPDGGRSRSAMACFRRRRCAPVCPEPKFRWATTCHGRPHSRRAIHKSKTPFFRRPHRACLPAKYAVSPGFTTSGMHVSSAVCALVSRGPELARAGTALLIHPITTYGVATGTLPEAVRSVSGYPTVPTYKRRAFPSSAVTRWRPRRRVKTPFCSRGKKSLASARTT